MTDFSPREIVSELDRFIIGQADAKRAVAVAVRPLEIHSKRVAVKAGSFILAVAAGWAFALFVRTAYECSEPLKTTLTSVGQIFRYIAECVRPLFR